MRKAITISLLLIFTTCQFGYHVLYLVQLHLIKEEAFHRLLQSVPDNELNIVVANDQEHLEWEEEGREFSLNGEMYDVARIEERNGKTFIYCVSDEREDALLKNYHDHYEKDLNGKAKENKLLKFQLTDFIQEKHGEPGQGLLGHTQNATGKCSKLFLLSLDVNAPPPRC